MSSLYVWFSLFGDAMVNTVYLTNATWFDYICSCNSRGRWHFHMLWVRRCAARQGVLFEDMCSLRIYFLPNFLVCVLSGMLFNLIEIYVFSRFLIVFYVLFGSVSGSLGGTTPSITTTTRDATIFEPFCEQKCSTMQHAPT